MVSYQPWRFGDRDLVRELRARQFRRNAGASDDAHYLEQWRVSDDGPKKPKYLGERAARAFDDITRFSAAPGTTARPTEKEGGGGGNPFSRTLGGLKDLGGEVLSTGLEVLGASQKYVGAPAFGVISGLTRSELYTDPKTGQQYRKSASFKDVGESLLAAVKDPVKAYREGAEATEQYFADPDKNVLHKAAGRAVTDPLSYVGPGVARAAIRSVGLQGTRAGRVGYELLESGGPGVVLGGNVAGEAEAEYGQRIPGWNRLSPEARMLIASLTGGVAGGVAARRIGKRGLEGIPGAKQGFGSVIEDVSEPTMRDGFETFKHSDIKERPEMFQGRDADAGKTYGERKVKNIVENFDPMRLEPGLVVHDVSTGDYVVVRGHHRLEAMKRLSEQGKVPETGTWQVVDADLSKPQQVQQLRKMAVLSNYGTSETNLREDLRAARVLLDEGADAGEIASQMRVTAQRADDLVHMSRLPADLIDRVVEMKADEGVAAEIARAASIYGLDEKDVRAMFGRYVTGSKSEISRTRLRSKLEQAGQMLAEERARGAQGGFGDIFGEGGWNDVRSEVLDVIDQLEARQNEITLSRQRLATVVRRLREFEDDPEIAREVATVRRAIEAKIQKLQEELDGITRDYETRRRARFEGTPDGGTRPDDRGIGEADRGAGGAIESPQQTGPGLFGDEVAPSRAEAEPQQGRPVEQQPPTPEEPGPVGEPVVRPQDAGPRPIGRADVEFSAQGTYRKTRFITLRSKVDSGKVFIQVKLERWPESPEWRVRLRTRTDQRTGAEVWETVSTHASLAEAKKAALDLVENDPRAVSDYRPRPEAPKEAPAPPTVKRVDIEGNVTDTGRTEAEINRPTSMDEPLPTARPKETGFQQSFDASVQELPGFGPEAPPKTKAPRGVPTEVQRIDEPGTVSSVEKPQGLYTSPGDIESPHADLGGAVVKFRTNPNARVLVIDSPGPALRRGSTASGAGVAALRSLVGEAEFDRLRQLSNADLRTEAASEYPNVDWSRYSDKQEVLEGLGGQKARDAGYDAIWDPTDADARFHEYVALTQNAFLPEGQEIGSRGANVQELPETQPRRTSTAEDAHGYTAEGDARPRVPHPVKAGEDLRLDGETWKELRTLDSGRVVWDRYIPRSAEEAAQLHKQAWEETGVISNTLTDFERATGKAVPDELVTSPRAEHPGDALARTEEPEARQQAGPEQEARPRQEAPKEEPKAEEPKAKAEEPSGPPPPLDRTDDWTILGLKKGQRYTEDEIRAAYRAQARRYHPDLNISATAPADMRDINAAFERLMKGQGETHGTSGSRSGDDYREQARRQRRAQDEQTRANEEARARRKQRENPPPGGQSGPDPYDWWAAWGSKPPEWGEGPPPPPRPKGPTFKHFDQDARYDLFNAESRSAQVQKQQAYLRSLRGQLNQAFRGLVKKLGGERFDRNLILDTVVRPFVVGEKGRTDNLINHWTAWFREEAETRLKRAGITVAKANDGAWRINGDAAMPTIEDVIERSTDRGRAFYDALTPEQRQAIEFLEWGNEAVNKTILAHGGKLPFDPDIEGTYFPRKVIGIGGNERTSGASSFKKSRTMESLDEGIGRDPDLGGRVEYDNPFDALEAGMRGKLRHAQDAYLRETLSPLAYKPNAAEGIRAGFGFDYVDHPALQGLLFKQDEADRIRAALQPGGENILTRLPKAVNRVLTPLRATGDLSATFQQGMITWLRDPKAAAKHWATTVMSLKDPELYFKAIDRLEADGPGLNEHIRWGGHYVNPHSTDEFLMPKVAKALSGGKYESIPVLGKVAQKSNEHFARFLNLARFDMANDAYKRALDLGLEGRALDDHMREAWNSINRATGWSARRPSTIEQLGLFAPRYFSASVEQVYTALTKGGIEGAIARRHLIRLTAAGATVAWLWNEANGHETEWDPRSNNFLRLRDVGGLDVSVFGTYDTLIRAVAGTVAGQAGDGIKPDVKRLVKFLESKMSPAMKLLYEPFWARETYLGEPLDVSTPGGAAKAVFEQAKSSIPFNVQDLIEEGPTAGFVGSTGLSARLLTEKEKLDRERDKLANTMFGRPYEQLGGKEKAQVNERESVTKIQAAKDAQDLRRGGDAARRVKIRQEFATRMAANAEFLKRGEDDAGNPFGGNDYREAYHELQTYLAGQRDTLKDISGDDKEVDGWFDLYDKAKMSNGQIDPEKLDALQADYRAKHPGIDEKVDQVTGIRDDPTLREYREAQKLAKKYYEIPAYQGMTLKDSRRAGEILKLAQGMVQSGEARNTKHALALLTAYDAEGVTLARRATRLGSNPQRRQFRLANPLFGRFYTNAASVLG